MQVLSARGKRSFTYSFIILVVISIFVLGYLLYFVPHNKKTIQNNGFLILSTIAANIEDAVESRVALPVNVYKNLKGLEKERRKEIVDAFQNGNISGSKINIIRTKDTLTGTELVTNIQFVDGQLKVSVYGPGETEGILYSESIQNFLDQFISTQKKELFHSYLFGTLRSPKSEVLYHDDDLPIRSDIGLDSLMPKMGTDFLAGTRDVVSQEEKQKMFYYPFNIRDKQFIICGFVDSDTYQSDLRKIPFYFIYPLAIAFLLLVISLPILKFYIMDSNEQVRVNDVLFFGVSVFLGAAFITLIIIQFLLWKGEENRVAKNLVTLAGQIKYRFGDELRKAYGEMLVLDTLIKEHKDPSNADSSETIRNYLIAHNHDPNYYYFDRISWIDEKGYQIIKGELKSQPVFTKVDKRNYFKVFSQGVPYYLPGDSTRRFGWEAINSVTNGGFNFTVSMQGKEYVAAMATRMYSLLNVIMPVGYGYCIINDSGVVQVHSDENRNLNENFFKKIDPADQIKGAVASRQARIVNDVVAYGKLQMIAVEPLHASMPFHIITFYEKGHIIPVNMRILVFTLLLCGLLTLTCGLLWWIIGWKNPKNNPLLFCSMDFLTWIAPKSEEGTYYFHGSFYLSVYFFALLGYVALNGPYDPNNFSILALVMVSPINIVFGLYCIRAAFTLPLSNRHWDELDKKRHEVLIYAALHLLISVVIFISVWNQYSIDNGFLVFQFVVNAIMWIYALASGRSKLVTYRSRKPFLFGYKFLLTALVVCLAVLPSSLITWYAHNQELIQTTKRQQLHLAKAIQDRSFELLQMKGASDSELLPNYYLDSLQFSGGIYKIQGDKISYDTCKVAENDVKTFDNFYFSLAEKLSIPYYDQQSYAGLEDNAKDSSWRWKRDADMNMNIWYQPSFPSRNFNPRDPRKCLHIVSTIPPRFVYLKGSATPIWLIILVLLLVYGLFQWLGRNTERIFLTRYVYSPRLRKSDENAGLIPEYFAGKETTGDEATLRLHSSSRYKDYHIHCEKNKVLEYEEEIVADLANGKEFYEYVWAHCTDKEKYLLFDYSEDGLINYKNAKEIIELINKGIFIVYEERLRIFSPGFRAFILNSVDRTEIYSIQKKYKANSTWQYVKVPLLILLCGIAAILFFTQQGVFNNLLILAGGVSTLLTIIMRFFGGGGGNGKKD